MPATFSQGVPQWAPARQPQQFPVAQTQQPRFRAQMGEEPERRMQPARVTLPKPEQLGIRKPPQRDNGLDWADARRRLDVLGAVTIQSTKLPEGGCRFTCLLATGRPNYNHRIEAEGATEAEAVRLGLERAESWARQR
jgi:hypothetical protein